MFSGSSAPKKFDPLALAFDLEERGHTAEAERHYLKVLQTQPKEWRALHQLGAICMVRGELTDALRYMGAAMKAKPSAAEAKSNYGLILQKLRRHDEALVYFKRALDTRPGYVSALLNRGTSLFQLNRPHEALAAFERALALEPQNIKALYNRANMLHELGRYEGSLAAMAQVTSLAPDYEDAHWNEALTRLLLGDFERGFEKYEHRWRTDGQKHLQRDFPQPLWLGGEPLGGKTVLIHAEQGFGDTVQFARYVPLLAAQGAEVILEVQPALRSLMTRIQGATRVIARGDELPPFDMQCPVMSLPLAFKTSLASVPAAVPYLAAPRDRLNFWRERLPPNGKRRIAVSWAGSATNKHDRLRSIPLEQLLPVIESATDIEWFTAQRDLRDGDETLLAARPQIKHLGREIADFSDTAAIVELADLVISVDTAVAHVAGALGKPVWVMLQYSPDFRWLLNRADSPWYPTARLFRQPEFGDWDDVIARVAQALGETKQPETA